MITTFYPPYHFGGEAMYLYRLSNALARLGHKVTVVHCVDSYRVLTRARPRGDFEHHPNVTVRPIRSRFGGLSPLVTYLSGQPGLKSGALDRVFASERFDIVHFHLVTLFGPGVLRYGQNSLRIYTMHDHWLVCPMYDLWKQGEELCEMPSCIRCSLSYHRPPQLWRYTNLLDRALPNIDLFLSPSHSTIEQHRRRGFRYPVQRLPLFLPLAEGAPPAQESAPDSRPYFLFVGRLVKIKGAQVLIEAFRRYHDADLLIAGDGDYEAPLRKFAAGMSHVRFLGRVHPSELRSYYRSAIAVLVPSLVYETFGFVTLEALGQRTPVIANDLGAVAEVVSETGGGITYRTVEQLLAAMSLLQQNPGLREELGSRGHRACVERYSEESHIKEYLGAIAAARTRRLSALSGSARQ